MGLDFAHEQVADMVDALDEWYSEELIEQAEAYAKRADFEHPINRSPKAVAAGSIYLASMLVNEPMTQTEIKENCDVSTVAIRDSYHEIAEYEGINLRRTGTGKRNDMDSWRPTWDELKSRVGGGQ